MNTYTFIDQIKQYLSRNELKAAFEAVGEAMKRCNSTLETELILLSNRFHQLNADMRMGTVDYTTAQLGQAQLVHAFSGMLDALLQDNRFAELMRQAEMETVHRGRNQVDDILEETLKRHQSNQQREVKKWYLENQAGVRVLEISTVDSKPQGTFLSKKNRILFGRSPDCDIVVYDRYFSRKHAELTIKNDELWLNDLNSINGTHFQGGIISGASKLNDSGALQLDQIFFSCASCLLEPITNFRIKI